MGTGRRAGGRRRAVLVTVVAALAWPAAAAAFPVEITWSGPPSTHEGATFGYTVTVRNTGSDPRDVFLHAGAGSRETVAAVVPSQGTCENLPTVRRCALGSLDPAASATVSFTSSISGTGGHLTPLTAMPTATGGVSTYSRYPTRVLPAGEPLLTDVRLSLTGPPQFHPAWLLGRYTLTATNHDSVPARGLALEGIVSYDDRLVRPSSSGPCARVTSWSPTRVRCEIGDLAPGASAQMEVEIFANSGFSRLAATLEQEHAGTAVRRVDELERSFTYGAAPAAPPGPSGGPGRSLVLTVAHPEAPVRAGRPFSWTDTVLNTGASPSGPLRLTAGTSGLVDMVEPTHANCTRTVVIAYCDLPSLGPGESTSVTFTGFAFDATGAVGDHSELVQSDGSTATAFWRNVAFDPGAVDADLAVVPIETGGGWSPGYGSMSITRWRVTNNGPGLVQHGVVRLRHSPAGVARVPAAWGDCVDCDFPVAVLRAGESFDVVTRTVASSQPVTHDVSVLATVPDPVPGNNAATHAIPPVGAPLPGPGGGGSSGPPDLSATIAAPKTTFAPNEQVHLIANVTNKPFFAAHGVRARIELPPDVRLLAPPVVERGSGCTGTSAVDCVLDYLPSGTTTPVRFAVDVGAPGTKTIVVRASASGSDRSPADNVASLSFTVVAPVLPPTPPATTRPRGVVKSGGAKADVLVGTAWADTLRGRGGNDRLAGKQGDDRLFGGAGNDRLDGGAGRDLLEGGAGNDTILARDGTKDTIRCGTGRDNVSADRIDVVAPGCELVRRR